MIVGGGVLLAAGLMKLLTRRARVDQEPEAPDVPASIQLQGVKWISLFMAIAGAVVLGTGLTWD